MVHANRIALLLIPGIVDSRPRCRELCCRKAAVYQSGTTAAMGTATGLGRSHRPPASADYCNAGRSRARLPCAVGARANIRFGWRSRDFKDRSCEAWCRECSLRRTAPSAGIPVAQQLEPLPADHQLGAHAANGTAVPGSGAIRPGSNLEQDGIASLSHPALILRLRAFLRPPALPPPVITL